MIELLFLLLVGHAVADFSLQTDVMAKGKSRHRRPDFIPDGQKYAPCWPYWLTSHALIHGGAVFIATNSILCAIIETVSHWLIDFLKCDNITNPNQDQLMHFAMKIIYVAILCF